MITNHPTTAMARVRCLRGRHQQMARENLERHITCVSAEVSVVGDVAFDRGTADPHQHGALVIEP
jgi:hypothetical protein